MRNARVFGWLSLLVLTAAASAQQTTIVPQVRTKPTADHKITTIELTAHFVTAIRVPEPVNSVVVGDPALFQVEHSEHEPELVFVKALTNGTCREQLADFHRERTPDQLSAGQPRTKARTRPRLISCCATRPSGGFLVEPEAVPFALLRRPPACRKHRLQPLVDRKHRASERDALLPAALNYGQSPVNASSPTQTGLSRQLAGTSEAGSHAGALWRTHGRR